jgi:imidazolonepropionase-like amidohydrolase
VGPETEIRRLGGSGARIVDLRGKTVIPGLIDGHVHLRSGGEGGESLTDADRTALAPVLQGYLRHGVTTVRVAGGSPFTAQLRDALDRGELTGPRLVMMGPPFSAPGGHPGVTVCRNNPQCRAGLREVSTADQARAYVREPANRGIVTLKVIVNFIPDIDIGRQLPSIPDGIVRAIVDEAHTNGLRVGAHVADTATTIRLAEIGVDEFMHLPDTISTPEDIQTLARLLASRKVPVTTTLSLRDAYRDAAGAERRVFGTPYGAETRTMFEQMLRTVATFFTAGVPLVVGTDCCAGSQIGDPRLMPGARTLHEMELLERAGIPRASVLAAATRQAAAVLRLDATTGTIAVGKSADLVIVTGDPRESLAVLRSPVAVLKGGRVAHGALP